MADTTYSVRVPEEVKEKLTSLMQDTGLKGKDFIEDMLDLYTLHKAKEDAPVVLQEEIDELRVATNRINTIYTNIIGRTQFALDSQNNKHKKELQDKALEIENLKMKIETEQEIGSIAREKISVLENEIAELQEELQEVQKNYSKYIGTTTDTLTSNKALIEEYKSKIDTLTSTIEEYKKYKVEVENLQKTLEETKQENNAQGHRIATDGEKIERLTNTIAELKEKHTEEIESNKDRLIFECDRKVLDLQKAHQEQVNKMQENYNAKVRELLEELEQVRKENRENKLDIKQD